MSKSTGTSRYVVIQTTEQVGDRAPLYQGLGAETPRCPRSHAVCGGVNMFFNISDDHTT